MVVWVRPILKCHLPKHHGHAGSHLMIVDTTHGAVTSLVDANSRDVVTKTQPPIETIRMYASIIRQPNGDVKEFRIKPFYQPAIDFLKKSISW